MLKKITYSIFCVMSLLIMSNVLYAQVKPSTLYVTPCIEGSKPETVSSYEPIAKFTTEPEAKEEVVILATEPQIIVLAFEDVHFDFDKSTLKPEAKMILKKNVQMLKDNPEAKVRIAGYTSASGTEEYNQKLSERRAKAVQEYLINEGIITRERLSIIGYGKKNPAIYEAAPKEIYSAEAKTNMRVLFEIIMK